MLAAHAGRVPTPVVLARPIRKIEFAPNRAGRTPEQEGRLRKTVDIVVQEETSPPADERGGQEQPSRPAQGRVQWLRAGRRRRWEVGEAMEAGHLRKFRDVGSRVQFKTKIGFRNNAQKHYRLPLLP